MMRVSSPTWVLVLFAALASACGGSNDDAPADEVAPSTGTGGASTGAGGSTGSGGRTGKDAGGASDAASPGSDSAGGSNTGGSTGGASGDSVATGGAPALDAGVPGWSKLVIPNDTTFDGWTIASDPVRPNDLYMGGFVDGLKPDPATGGILKSTDYGVSWTKIATGAGSDVLGMHPIALKVDSNPKRSPSSPPVIYAVAYFAGGLWKSTDGGTNFTSIWADNIFSVGGQNISKDVGIDVSTVLQPDPNDVDHLLVYMHANSASGISGIFESTDGGGKWTLHESTLFSFEPHNSIVSTISAKTWMVFPGTVSSSTHCYRSSDAGVTWADMGVAPMRGMGAHILVIGGTVYSASDYNSGIAKSLDDGKTWALIPNTGGATSWLVASDTKIYTSSGRYDSTVPPKFEHTGIGDGVNWSIEEMPAQMTSNGTGAVMVNDGVHHMIIALQRASGIWRYVEP
jgi:hypothetical protein